MSKASRWLSVAILLVVLVMVSRMIFEDAVEDELRTVASETNETAGSTASMSGQEPESDVDDRTFEQLDLVEMEAERLTQSESDSAEKELFSTPEYGTNAYRVASEQASKFFAALGSGYSRNMVVRADAEAIRELIRRIESNPDGLGGSFNISAFSDVPCVVSSIRSRTPPFTPGSEDVPSNYLVEAPCQQSRRTLARISVTDRNTYQIDLISQDWGAFSVIGLWDWEYPVAFRDDKTSEGLFL
jgi:hypothetical protein